MLRSFQTQQSKQTLHSVPRPLKSTVSSSSLYGTDVVVEEHRQLVDNIAKHVIHGALRSNKEVECQRLAFNMIF